jgi:hypothetical protein
MKKYILISYGDFTDNPKTTYLLDSICDITTTELLTYKIIDNSIVINFGTNIEFNKLKNYVSILFERISNFYFLIEHNESMLISFPDNEKDSFLNLGSTKTKDDIENLTEKLLVHDIILSEMENIVKNFDNEINDDIDDEDVLIKKSLKKEYTLDEILDKINEKGISSLTKEENNYLKNLSK